MSGYNQKEISEKLGYSGSVFLSLIETGNSKVPTDMIPGLVKLLKIPEDLILSIMLQDYVDEAKEIFKEERKIINGKVSSVQTREKTQYEKMRLVDRQYNFREVNVILTDVKRRYNSRIKYLEREIFQLKEIILKYDKKLNVKNPN